MPKSQLSSASRRLATAISTRLRRSVGELALPPRTPTAIRPGQCQIRAAITPSTAYTSSSARFSLGGSDFGAVAVADIFKGLTRGSRWLKEHRTCVPPCANRDRQGSRQA